MAVAQFSLLLVAYVDDLAGFKPVGGAEALTFTALAGLAFLEAFYFRAGGVDGFRRGRLVSLGIRR